jgi:glycosyltransferase involved in cell wall biosynthesis
MSLSASRRWKIALANARARLAEYIQFDSILLGHGYALVALATALLCACLGRHYTAFSLLSGVHRRIASRWLEALVERILHRLYLGDLGGPRFAEIRAAHRARAVSPEELALLKASLEPGERFFWKRLLIVKSPRENEKGVIIVKYTNMLKLFFEVFDVPRLAREYHIVLEPSWVGYCDLDILFAAGRDFPIFVQASEPRDSAFLERLGANLIPISTGANWWVDHRVFRPLPDVEKDIDCIMVAGWDDFKRHRFFFRALAALKRRGITPGVVLIGGRLRRSSQEVLDEAVYFGVHDQVTVIEDIDQREINLHLNRSRVFVLWSRKEGFNKSLIEAMFADVPCILREGFNFGYRYAHINPQTGRYAGESQLPAVLTAMLADAETFAPRSWVMTNMSCQAATRIVNEFIKDYAEKTGENWTTDILVKVNDPNLAYWDPSQRELLARDYERLASFRSE